MEEEGNHMEVEAGDWLLPSRARSNLARNRAPPRTPPHSDWLHCCVTRMDAVDPTVARSVPGAGRSCSKESRTNCAPTCSCR